MIARRIRQACWLLKTTTLSVEGAGMEVGYANTPYFCQVFKKMMGFSPLQYRHKSGF